MSAQTKVKKDDGANAPRATAAEPEVSALRDGIAIAELHGSMALAFAEIAGATKQASGQVGNQKYKYADLTAVIEAIKPALIQHGLFFTQRPEPHDNGILVETMLHHEGGESMSLGKLFVPANKKDAQGFGSALTYARRYALVTAFGVPVEDDDGSAATAAPTELIGDAQWAELTQLMQASKADTRAFCQAYGIESVKALPAAAFPKAKAQLERKLSQLAEASND